MSVLQGEQSPTQVFLSYAHDDDNVLSFVKKFADDLTYYSYADRGRNIKVFWDYEIEWGEDWRDKIYENVRGASAFVPLVTIRYLDRPMCREELVLFVDSAEKLGVVDLFLPVVVLGQGLIRDDSDNAATRHVATRQYINLREAVLAGTDSATWRRQLVALANKLVNAIERAEEHLANNAERLADIAPASDLELPEDRPDDAPSLQDHYQAAVRDVEEFGPILSSFAEVLNDFKEHETRLTRDIAGKPSSVAQARLITFAKEFGPKAHEAEELGRTLEEKVASADQNLRAVSKLLAQYGTRELRNAFSEEVESTVEFMQSIEQADSAAEHALDQFKSIEVLNVPVRRALRPLRNGLRSASSAMRTMLTWRDLGHFPE